MPSYFLKALENTQSILCGLFIVWGHFCSRKTASHRTALDFRGIFVLLEAGGLSPANDKRAKSSEKAGCPTCLPLLIDALISGYSNRTWGYSLFDITAPPDVVLFSYIRGCFVYCPFLLVRFTFSAQIAFDEKSHIKLYSDRFSPNSPKRENPT